MKKIQWNQALILTTAFSYATAMVYSFFSPTPILVNTPNEGIIFGIMGIILVGCLFFEVVRYFSMALYGMLAPLSFLGVQKWNNYHGTTSLGPWMALWDLALAIAILTMEDT